MKKEKIKQPIELVCYKTDSFFIERSLFSGEISAIIVRERGIK